MTSSIVSPTSLGPGEGIARYDREGEEEGAEGVTMPSSLEEEAVAVVQPASYKLAP